MAFVFTAEDGTGIEDANAYIDVAFADEYHAGRANAAWAAASVTIGEKRAAIVRATDYIESVFGARFLGIRKVGTQGLSWPRVGAWLDDALVTGVPDAVKRATAEYALRSLAGPLEPDGNDDAITSESKTAGGITHSVTYASAQGLARYPAADRHLRCIVHPILAWRA